MMFGEEQNTTALNKTAMEKTGPLDEAQIFVEGLTKQLQNLRQQLASHSDKVFGERETVSGQEKNASMPIPSASGGKLNQLSTALSQLEFVVINLDDEVRRSCQF